jgi:hypothetical protein
MSLAAAEQVTTGSQALHTCHGVTVQIDDRPVVPIAVGGTVLITHPLRSPHAHIVALDQRCLPDCPRKYFLVGFRDDMDGAKVPPSGINIMVQPKEFRGELDRIISRSPVIGQDNVRLLTSDPAPSDLKRIAGHPYTPVHASR